MNNDTEQIYLLNTIQTQSFRSIQKQDPTDDTPHNLDNVEDFTNVCRTCATITQLVVPIFAGEGLEHHLADKIHKHLPIKVSETDMLPLVVCYQCVSTMLAWHELVECCLQADRALRAKVGDTTIDKDVKGESYTDTRVSHDKAEDTQSQLNRNIDLNNTTELNDNADFTQSEAQPPRDPPKYTPPRQLCEFCNTTYSQETYINHLIVEHSQLNGRLFITHFFQHATTTQQSMLVQLQQINWDSYLRNNDIIYALPNYTTAPVKDTERSIPVSSSQNSNTTSTEAVTAEQEIPPQKAVSDQITTKDDSSTTGEVKSNLNFDDEATLSAKPNKKQKGSSQSTTTGRNAPATENRVTNTICLRSRRQYLTAAQQRNGSSNLMRNNDSLLGLHNPSTNSRKADVSTNKAMSVISNRSDSTTTTTTTNNGGDLESIGVQSVVSDTVVDNETSHEPFSKSNETQQNIPIVADTSRTASSNIVESNANAIDPALKEARANVDAISNDIKTPSFIVPLTSNPNITSTKLQSKWTEQNTKIVKSNEDNDFSDHSDIESGFDPLPNSVFEAIEDTQDSQEAGGSNQTGDIEESNKIGKNFKHLPLKKPRTCPICSKVYKAASSYFYHLKHTHKRVKEHECKVCLKKFATKASLTSHSTIHTGECHFECKTCKKRFRSNASLYIHEQTHNGLKKFSCQQCDTSFRWKTHLVRHMKRHADERTHVCPTCGRGFSVRYDLVRHVRTHSAGEFSCEECDVKFAQLRYLKVHMEKKHSQNAGTRRKVI